MTSRKFLPEYTVPLGGDLYFKVRPTANAWWKNPYKVSILLGLLRAGVTLEEICKMIGITRRQYKYFALTHPEINKIKEAFLTEAKEVTKKTLISKIENSPSFALKYLNRTNPEQFPYPSHLEKIEGLKDQIESLVQKHREEIRRLKIVVAKYQAATRLKDTKTPDDLLERYNYDYPPAPLPHRETKHYVVSLDELERQYNEAQRKNPS